VIAVPAGAILYNTHQRFVAWSLERDAWHQKCDPYVNTPLSNPAARACNEELQRLTAIASAVRRAGRAVTRVRFFVEEATASCVGHVATISRLNG
jgi:hypothetical protein